MRASPDPLPLPKNRQQKQYPAARVEVGFVPTGIATEATTAPFFAALINRKRLARLIFLRTATRYFPAVHRSYKFSLLTIGRESESSRIRLFS
jgi:hypothetical protein